MEMKSYVSHTREWQIPKCTVDKQGNRMTMGQKLGLTESPTLPRIK